MEDCFDEEIRRLAAKWRRDAHNLDIEGDGESVASSSRLYGEANGLRTAAEELKDVLDRFFVRKEQ